MKSVFFGYSAKLALALLAVGAMTSCYEKEEVDKTPAPTPEPAKYYIQGNVLDVDNGQALNAKVTVDGVAVAVTNGYYRTEVDPDKDITIVADMDNYFTATKTAYLPKTEAGSVSIATVDFALVGLGTQIVTPDDPNAVNTPATNEQAQKAAEASKNELVEIFKAANLIEGADDLVIEVVDGAVIATATKDIANPAVAQDYTFDVPLTSGFSSDITPETKALTRGQIWIANAEKTMGMKYGMEPVKKQHTFNAVQGAAISRLIVKAYYQARTLSFNESEGTLIYQEKVVATVTYDDHDAHDGHDWHDAHDSHGFTSPGAGGGSSQGE